MRDGICNGGIKEAINRKIRGKTHEHPWENWLNPKYSRKLARNPYRKRRNAKNNEGFTTEHIKVALLNMKNCGKLDGPTAKILDAEAWASRLGIDIVMVQELKETRTIRTRQLPRGYRLVYDFFIFFSKLIKKIKNCNDRICWMFY